MTHFDAVKTREGDVHVLTKKRWWNILTKPHTSLMPTDFRDLGRLGVVMYWSTTNPTLLKQLHDSVVESLQLSSLREIRDATDMARTDPLAAFAVLARIFRPPVTQYVKRLW